MTHEIIPHVDAAATSDIERVMSCVRSQTSRGAVVGKPTAADIDAEYRAQPTVAALSPELQQLLSKDIVEGRG